MLQGHRGTALALLPAPSESGHRPGGEDAPAMRTHATDTGNTSAGAQSGRPLASSSVPDGSDASEASSRAGAGCGWPGPLLLLSLASNGASSGIPASATADALDGAASSSGILGWRRGPPRHGPGSTERAMNERKPSGPRLRLPPLACQCSLGVQHRPRSQPYRRPSTSTGAAVEETITA